MSEKNTSKRVVIHEDDVGVTHNANMAFAELSALGSCSAGSVMVPCPWFPEAVKLAHDTPSLDLGVHITLTSEQTTYRWRPLTAPPASAGLTDDLGYFWPDVPSARKAAPEAVEAEMRAQVETALAAGIDVTHFDAHMGTAMTPEFVGIYRRLGKEFGVPVLLVKDLGRFNPRSYAGDIDIDRYDAEIVAARADGDLIFDQVIETPWTRTSDAETAYSAMFASISEGLTYLALHFNPLGDFELFNRESATIRHEEYAYFRGGRVAELVEEHGIELVGMRDLRTEQSELKH